MTYFEKVQWLLDAAVAPGGDPDPGPHGAFWNGATRDEFVELDVLGKKLLVLGDSSASNLVRALRGQLPFGKDQGVPGASTRRMPAGLPMMAEDDIKFIESWIDANCPNDPIPDPPPVVGAS